MMVVKVIEFPLGSLEWRILNGLQLGLVIDLSEVAAAAGVGIERVRGAVDSVLAALGPDGALRWVIH